MVKLELHQLLLLQASISFQLIVRYTVYNEGNWIGWSNAVPIKASEELSLETSKYETSLAARFWWTENGSQTLEEELRDLQTGCQSSSYRRDKEESALFKPIELIRVGVESDDQIRRRDATLHEASFTQLPRFAYKI